MPSPADLESIILHTIASSGEVADSGKLAADQGVDHNVLVGVIKSLSADELISESTTPNSKWDLTEEGKAILATGASPEFQLFNAIPADGISLNQLKTQLGQVADVGFRFAMQNKWIAIDKSSGESTIQRKVDSVEDKAFNLLRDIGAASRDLAADDKEAIALAKRKVANLTSWKTFKLTKGANFALERKKAATDLTSDMITKGTWRQETFKPYNFAALGRPPSGGHLHPLLKVRTQFRKIFTAMGFEEMPTNNYVESSFWNFDVLFQPQQHPARDAHDTFFLLNPASTPASSFPPDYLQRVKTTHESGGFGSTGYGYAWQEAEAEKNLLRTHTTAVSSRMLYKLAQEGFRPAKYFSVDRVFRNEAIDRTHLAEFHQIEGLVCDHGLTLGDLLGTLELFFTRLGLKKLRFKPAYNPYTEPSMEIFSYSEELGKWMEVGNSGMFRPEMLRPMGLPEGVNVIAWGLSLERPTMILYGIDNIRDLFGHKVSLGMVRKNPICRLGL
jgi:phenylalanyl-tRNA synthetase alpha chain